MTIPSYLLTNFKKICKNKEDEIINEINNTEKILNFIFQRKIKKNLPKEIAFIMNSKIKCKE